MDNDNNIKPEGVENKRSGYTRRQHTNGDRSADRQRRLSAVSGTAILLRTIPAARKKEKTQE